MYTIAINLTTSITLIMLIVIFKCGATQNEQMSASDGVKLGAQYDPTAIVFPSSVEEKGNFQHQHPFLQQHHHFHHHHHHDHNFQHNPDFHRSFDTDIENEPPEENLHTNNYGNSSLIPLDLILKVNNYTEVNDLLFNLVEGDIEEKDESMTLMNRFGEGRNAVITPKAANCMPELQTVKIVSNGDPSVLYIPSCTRIERCGGCCSHSLLACQPIDTETVSFQVVKTQFVGGSKLKYMGKEIILMEKHTKCKCSCKEQEKDCSSFQEYRQSECRCLCTNTDEEKKCYKENATKLWNPQVCGCQCRNILPCSTGYSFDTLRCKCKPNLVRRRFAELPYNEEKEIYKPEAPRVLALHETNNVKH